MKTKELGKKVKARCNLCGYNNGQVYDVADIKRVIADRGVCELNCTACGALQFVYETDDGELTQKSEDSKYGFPRVVYEGNVVGYAEIDEDLNEDDRTDY